MKTNSLFATNLPAYGTNDIHGIRPPVEIPLSLPWIIAIVVAIVFIVAAIIIFAIWYSRKKAATLPPVMIIPPHERARLKLQEALALMDQPRAFCILVSDTVRQYLEERFTFHAPDRTTEEFLYELQATELLLPDQKQSLGEFLSVCDMAKFARYEPGPPELQALYDSALRLVDETEPQPVALEGQMTETTTQS
jgi:hypothetical protein